MSSQLSYRLHGREQRPKTLRKRYRDELDTGQVTNSRPTMQPPIGLKVTDAVEKGFLGNLCATLIQNEGQKAQVRFKKWTPMIRLLRSSRMAPSFSTASDRSRH